ncbi:ANGI protein, partial [Polyodon spathula]|nr:ANGI protein [Polyodon spathula]
CSALLLAVMCAASVSAETPYDKFLRQHYYNGGMSVQMCDSVMTRRSLVNPCKQTNSFIINAIKNDIIAVCKEAGKPYITRDGRNLRISSKPFTVVTCNRKGGSNKPPCNYRGNRSTRNIVIDCVNDLPVHYEEGIIAA